MKVFDLGPYVGDALYGGALKLTAIQLLYGRGQVLGSFVLDETS